MSFRVIDPDVLLDGGGELNMTRADVSTIALTATSGSILFTPFLAKRSEAITHVKVRVGATAAATITLIRVGIYAIDQSGNLTLISAMANLTTMCNTANAVSSTGTLTTTFNKVQGRLYATAFIFVGTTAPTLWGGAGLTSTSTATVNPFDLMPFAGALRRSGQTDLVTPVTKANLSIVTATNAPYVEMLP